MPSTADRALSQMFGKKTQPVKTSAPAKPGLMGSSPKKTAGQGTVPNDFWGGMISDIQKRVKDAGGIGGVVEKAEGALRGAAPKLKEHAEKAADTISAARKTGKSLWGTLKGHMKRGSDMNEAFVHGLIDEMGKEAGVKDLLAGLRKKYHAAGGLGGIAEKAQKGIETHAEKAEKALSPGGEVATRFKQGRKLRKALTEFTGVKDSPQSRDVRAAALRGARKAPEAMRNIGAAIGNVRSAFKPSKPYMSGGEKKKEAGLDEAFIHGLIDELTKSAQEPDEYRKRDPEIGAPPKTYTKRRYSTTVGGPTSVLRGEPTHVQKDIPSFARRMAKLRHRSRK